MGGRGARSGISEKGIPYGTEYTTLYQSGNIKFIKYNGSTGAKTPQDTMTRGRVYALINAKNRVHSIIYFDNDNKRVKQIDLEKDHKGLLPHTHHGYDHNEYGSQKKGAANLTPEEKKMVDRVNKLWYNHLNAK